MFIDPKRIPHTGNPLIDVGHERLALVINEAYDAWQMGKVQQDWLEILDSFLEMLAAHFLEEETLAEQRGYAKTSSLHQSHEYYLGQLKSLARLVRENDPGAPAAADLFNHFDRLIYEHELVDDQELWDVFQPGQSNLGENEKLIVWEKSFLVGNDDIDRQHQSLVIMLNHLHRLIVKRSDLAEIVALLKEVRVHVAWHFGFEESVMKASAYHGLQSHHALHAHLLLDLDQVIRDVASRRYEELEELLENYLKYWLLDHILHVDMALGKELARQQDMSGA